LLLFVFCFLFQAGVGIRVMLVAEAQACALPIPNPNPNQPGVEEIAGIADDDQSRSLGLQSIEMSCSLPQNGAVI